MTDVIKAPSVWLSTEEVADRLHVPVGAVRKWRAERTGPKASKFGRHVRYHVDDVDEWAQGQVSS